MIPNILFGFNLRLRNSQPDNFYCFRCWELWSLGGLGDFCIPPKLSPNLPAAKANKRSHKEVTGLEFFMIFPDSYNCACPLAPIGAIGYNFAVPSQRERRSLTYRRAPSRRAGRHIGLKPTESDRTLPRARVCANGRTYATSV